MGLFYRLGSGDGYLRYTDIIEDDGCYRYWWTNLLFINNLFPWFMADTCLGWVWYLANDFQFFLISPCLIACYCKNRVKGYRCILWMLLILPVIPFVTSFVVDLPPGMMYDGDLIYERPWSRFAPYGVGAILGLMYFEYTSGEIQNTRATRWFSMV